MLTLAFMQLVLFVNDKTVSKGMVKYAANLTRESVVDVEGTISVPPEPVAGCSQSEVQTATHTRMSFVRKLILAFPSRLFTWQKVLLSIVHYVRLCYSSNKSMLAKCRL